MFKEAGRNPKLSYNKINQVYELVKDTAIFDKDIAFYAGVTEGTWYRWQRNGKSVQRKMEANPDYEPNENERLYLTFFIKLNQAHAEQEINLLDRIREFFEHDWRATAWFLERRYSERWSKKQLTTNRHEGA